MRVAKTLVYDNDGYALILYRSPTHPLYPHEPDLPGGIIEPGESFAAGVAREISEEAGITIRQAALTLLADTQQVGSSHRRLYEVRLTDRPAVRLSWEHERYAWVAPDTIAAILAEGRDAFNTFVRKQIIK